MFDVGFPELVLIAVIGLLVLGPQRLPKVAAELGKWIGRARRTATQLRRQLEREIELEDLERMRAARPPPPAATPPVPSSEPPAETSATVAPSASEPGPMPAEVPSGPVGTPDPDAEPPRQSQHS
jgi:sec-independent protein translocase protein TatB